MIITIRRNYFPCGTNGRLYLDGVFQCYTIELPWLNNKPQVSCIPEGEYTVEKRYNAHNGRHFMIRHVPGRELILIHAANNALQELKGCIAPVTSLLNLPGQGNQSRLALSKIYALVFPVLGGVVLRIVKDEQEVTGER